VSHPVLHYHQQQLPQSVTLLRRIVELESPTNNKAATDQLGRFLQARLEDLGASVTVLPQEHYGDFLRAEFGAGTDGQILVLCHFDTVWPLGEVERRPIFEQEGKIYGPGIFDMKCGVIFVLMALQAMKDLQLDSRRKIVLLFNTDEEVGSPASRQTIEAEALKSDVVLVLEPTVPPNGSIKTARRGVGRFTLKVTGRPSHSGSNPKGGVSALEELARQILTLHSMTGHEAGITVNVGVATGGTRPNVVAGEAICASSPSSG
jgi:glutamate carboxypeptidase